MTETYRISADEKSITCLRCGLTSYNPEDIRRLYCGRCHHFHEGLPTMTEPTLTIELTRQQYMALVSVLIDHRLRRDSTLEWIDVLTDSRLSIDDLIAAVMNADRIEVRDRVDR